MKNRIFYTALLCPQITQGGMEANMKKKITDREKRWFDAILSEKIIEKPIIIRQIEKAEMEIHSGYDFLSIKIFVSDEDEICKISSRVPVEMICLQQNKSPIVFLLHILCGKVDELEIITADSSYLDVDNIDISNRIYCYDASTMPMDLLCETPNKMIGD